MALGISVIAISIKVYSIATKTFKVNWVHEQMDVNDGKFDSCEEGGQKYLHLPGQL